MAMITSYKKTTIRDAMIQITFDMPERYGRETQRLVEEQMDLLTSKMKGIIIAISEHLDE